MYLCNEHDTDNHQKTLHGIYTSIIPEENEDVLVQVQSSGLPHESETEKVSSFKKPVVSITDEVKKLGFTAEINKKNNSNVDENWIEIGPNVRGRFCRIGYETNKDNLKDDEIVQESTTFKTSPKLRSPTSNGCPQLDVNFQACFRKRPILNAPQTTKVNNTKTFEGRNENSHFIEQCETASICSSIDSINSIDEGRVTFSDLECNVFNRNDSLRRTNSESCLRKIRDRISLPDITEIHTCETCRDTIQQGGTQTLLLGRKSSTSDGNDLGYLQNKDKHNVSTDDSKIYNHKFNSNEDTDCGFAHHENVQFRPRSKTIGVIQWARSNKVRHSKRESNMFSPTAF